MLVAIYSWMKAQDRPVKMAEVIYALGLSKGAGAWHMGLLKEQGCIVRYRKNGWFTVSKIAPKAKPPPKPKWEPRVAQEIVCTVCEIPKRLHEFTRRNKSYLAQCKACRAEAERLRPKKTVMLYKPPKGNAAGVLLQELTCCWGVPREDERMAA